MSDNQEKPNTNSAPEKIDEKASVMTQKTYGDFLGAYKSFSETTSKIVQQAAEILETEIASGIKIATETENRIPQIERFKSEKPDEIMQRFRRDAHEVVDIFIDVVGASLKSIPNLDNMIIMRDGTVTVKPMQVTPVAQRPVIMSTKPVKPGQNAEIQITFENSRDVETEEFNLYSTDLISNKGERLPSGLVRFSPQSLKIGPFKTEQITVTIAVPEETKPDVYSGLVLASNMAQLRSEIVLKVE
jgi:hypothetical protein